MVPIFKCPPRRTRETAQSIYFVQCVRTVNIDSYKHLPFIIKSFYSLWSIRHPWRASRHCALQLSPWLLSVIVLCFLSHPVLSIATFSSAYLSFNIPEDSNLMQFSLLLLFLYVMCVQSNSVKHFPLHLWYFHSSEYQIAPTAFETKTLTQAFRPTQLRHQDY